MFKVGDRVRVIYNPEFLGGYIPELEGHEGTVIVKLYGDRETLINYGVDFGKRISEFGLHDLDGDIETLTGRYFYGEELVLVQPTAEFKIIEDPRFSELYV